jgi:hypothetical protein
MVLDYSAIEFDSYGRPVQPELVLETLAGEVIGVIQNVLNLNFNIKFAELSEISFEVLAESDGVATEVFDSLAGYHIVHTAYLGDYVIFNPEENNDGITRSMSVQGYSIEKLLESKRFFFVGGNSYTFWDPVNPDNTIVGLILEVATDWSVGYVAPSLWDQKHYFDDNYDDYLLSFIYDTIPEKCRCIFVFDHYGTKDNGYKPCINIYDADEKRETVPVYLDFENLIQETNVEEITDELVTALRPYGADELSVSDVNPIGTGWIYDISYFIEHGDVPDALAQKWDRWQNDILINQSLYLTLTQRRASAITKLTTYQTELTELDNELKTLEIQQSTAIAGDDQDALPAIYEDIQKKEEEIAQKEAQIKAMKQYVGGTYDDTGDEDGSGEESLYDLVHNIVDVLKFSAYFTEDEQRILSRFFIEQDLTDETYVLTETTIDTALSHPEIENGSFAFSGSTITYIAKSGFYTSDIYTIVGGTLVISGGESDVNINVTRGTLEVSSDNTFVLSCYAGTIKTEKYEADSGTVTVTGTISSISNDVAETDEDGVTSYVGSRLSFSSTSNSVYISGTASDYQQYSVQLQLYNYGVSVLSDLCQPTYEFTIDTANFLFASEFAGFRDSLELGCGVYLRLNNDKVITPILIEVELDYENQDSLSLVFSNRFKRYDNVNTLKDMIESTYSTSRSFDVSKYTYDQTTYKQNAVSEFMSSALDAAKNMVIGASNQSVVIDGAGIHVTDVSGNSNFELRIVNGMIAMTNDGWQSSNLAIGQFTTDGSSYSGVNASVIMGKLLVGNNLVIQHDNTLFRVDADGVTIDADNFLITHSNNTTQSLQKDLDGIANDISQTKKDLSTEISNAKTDLSNDIGTVSKNLSDVLTTDKQYLNADKLKGVINATAASMKSCEGNVLIDSEGIWLLDNTSKDKATAAVWMNENGIMLGYGDATPDPGANWGDNWKTAISAYGIEAEALAGKYLSGCEIVGGTLTIGNKGTGKYFNVDSSGNLTAESGTFSGTLKAGKISGTISNDGESWLVGAGLKIGANNSATNDYNFYVNTSGNVWMEGSITMKGSINLSGASSITWSSSNSPVKVLYSQNSDVGTPVSGKNYSSNSTSTWHTTCSSDDLYASYSYDGGTTWTTPIKIRGEDGEPGQNGKNAETYYYLSKSGITGNSISSPYVYGGLFYATGQGENNGAAYYICNGFVDIELTTPNHIGYICYDDKGAGTSSESKYRVIIHTEKTYPIKLDSGSNMSLSANGTIYLESPTAVDDVLTVSQFRLGATSDGTNGISYGTTEPTTHFKAIGITNNPEPGQLYFKINS